MTVKRPEMGPGGIPDHRACGGLAGQAEQFGRQDGRIVVQTSRSTRQKSQNACASEHGGGHKYRRT